MAKKPSRSGGRVTPKGTQPAPSKSSQAPSPRSSFEQTTRNQPPPNGRSAGAPGGPSRAGRRGGNR